MLFTALRMQKKFKVIFDAFLRIPHLTLSVRRYDVALREAMGARSIMLNGEYE